jgi:hypothetical protein
MADGRVIGRVRQMSELPQDAKPWMWSVTDPDLAGWPGWTNTHGEMPSRLQAMARLIKRWQELRVSAALSFFETTPSRWHRAALPR